MSQKKLCFRFDVDTHKCAKMGMPRLVSLGKRLKVPFTFYLNCGQSIHLASSLKALLFKSAASNTSSFPQLGALRKFGGKEYLRCALLNPQILPYAKSEVLEAFQAGHEIGLHGGRNHELWGRFVNQWSDEEIHAEIQWGLDQLTSLGISPTSFSSPCAAGGERVRKIVSKFQNFEFISDDLNPRSHTPRHTDSGLMDVPTELCGDGGVAYIEQLVALNKSENEIIAHFEQRIQDIQLGVFYDHPYFAADEGLPVLEKLIETAMKHGFKITTLTEIGRTYENRLSRKSS